MKCSHCLVEFFSKEIDYPLGHDKDGNWHLIQQKCPACNRWIMHLQLFGSSIRKFLIWPKGTGRHPCSPFVPIKYVQDYEEACTVLADSPKASAALSRRCLQNLLRDEAHVKTSDLVNEIQEILDRKDLPSHIHMIIDAVRNIGNFAAHPVKSKSTGEIVPVELGEAELNLDVIEALFDFYFVQPSITKAKMDVLDAKLKDAGRKPVKKG